MIVPASGRLRMSSAWPAMMKSLFRSSATSTAVRVRSLTAGLLLAGASEAHLQLADLYQVNGAATADIANDGIFFQYFFK